MMDILEAVRRCILSGSSVLIGRDLRVSTAYDADVIIEIQPGTPPHGLVLKDRRAGLPKRLDVNPAEPIDLGPVRKDIDAIAMAVEA